MTSDTPPQTKRIFCNYCKVITNHVLHGSHHREENDEMYNGWWEESDYRFWVCAGCDSAVLEERYIDVSMSMADEHEYRFFPKPRFNHVQGKLFIKLPAKLRKIYRETIQAFNEELYILTAAGWGGGKRARRTSQFVHRRQLLSHAGGSPCFGNSNTSSRPDCQNQ